MVGFPCVTQNNLCSSKTLTIRIGFLALPYNFCSLETLTIRVGFLASPNNLCVLKTLTIMVGFLLCYAKQFVLFKNIDN
jgi:hypothetical protein